MQDVHRPVDSVALADSSQVSAHPLPLQKRGPRALVDHQVTIVDQRETREDVRRLGHRVVLFLIVELPQAGQGAERDVEPAAGPLAHLMGNAEHLTRLRTDAYRMLAGGRLPA